MSDDLPDVQFSDQTDDASSEPAPSGAQPVGPGDSELNAGQPGEAAPASGEPAGKPREADYTADLRQSLRQEGDRQEKPAPGLWRRMTRSLRRERRTGDTASPIAGEAPAQSLAEPPAPAFEEESPETAGESPEPAVETPAASETPAEEMPAEDDEWLPEELAAAQYLETLAPEASQPEEPPASDEAWMADLREAIPPETSGPTDEEQRGADSLREFIARLRGQEGQENTAELSDDLLTGRLERSLGLSSQEGAPAGANDEESQEPDQLIFDTSQAPLFEKNLPDDAGPLPPDLDLSEIFPDARTPADDEASLLENQEARFSDAGEENLPEEGFEALPPSAGEAPAGPEPAEGSQPGETPAPPEAASPLETPQPETPGETPAPPSIQPLDLSKTEEKRAPGETHRLSADDAYAVSYLTGAEYIPPEEEEEEAQSPDYLLQQALERARSAEPAISNEDLRAIALEDYQEAPESQPGAAPVDNAGENLAAPVARPEAAARPSPASRSSWSLRDRFASRSLVEKILLVEAVVVALVVIVAVPFFILTIARNADRPAASAGIAPRPLPGSLPYPVGVTLPGGWYFPLAKSTFVDGKWQPVTSEWLEGTEVRRVVAVPWNSQTEAVVHSFKPGDVIRVLLSNQETAEYKVASVQRVPVTDTSILKDQTPSLVIILYQENASERWVILSEP